MELKQPASSYESKLTRLIGSLQAKLPHHFLSLLDGIQIPHAEMHRMLDDIFLLNLHKTIDIQYIPKDDEEEQKELHLKKQYDLFTREAQDLHKELEQLSNEPMKEAHKIQQHLQIYQSRQKEWNHRFKKLQLTGSIVIDDLKKKLGHWMEQLQEETCNTKEQQEISRAKEHPHRLFLITALTSLNNSIEDGSVTRVKDMKRKVLSITEQLSFEEIASRAGLLQSEESKQLRKIKQECQQQLQSLYNYQRELQPKETVKKSKELGKLEDKAEYLKSMSQYSATQKKELMLSEKAIEKLILGLFEQIADLDEQEQSDYLIQPQPESSNLLVFNITKSAMRSFQLSFIVPQHFSSCHVNNALYICGGYLGSYLDECKKISYFGNHQEIQKLLNPKCYFPIAFWRSQNSLFTVGGFQGFDMKQVTQYSIDKNIWMPHSQLPLAINGSSAVILNDVIYNLGGINSPHSLMICNLVDSSPAWKPVEIDDYSFMDFSYQMAYLVNHDIVFFGSNSSKATYILQKDDEQKLKVVKQDQVVNFTYYDYAMCSRVVNEKYIFTFSNHEYTQIHRYSVEDAKWTLHFPS